MLPQRLFFAGLLATAPFLGMAQSAAPAVAVPRFFVGLEGSFGGYPVPKYDTGSNVASVVPTVGLQVRPRLAVQLSAAYDQDHSDNTFSYPDNPANPGLYVARTNWRSTLVVPVLARYTLTRQLKHRFQADLLGGVSIVHYAVRSTVFNMLNYSVVESTYEETNRATAGCLTLGAGARYAVWPRLELTAEAVLNRQVTSPMRTGYFAHPNLTAGLRYRFGRSL